MAKGSSGGSTIVTLLIVGGIGYVLYEWWQSSTGAVASSATPAASPTSPTEAAAPTTTTPVTAPVSTPVQPANISQAQVTAANSLDATYTKLIQVATQNAPKTGIGANEIQLVSGQPQMNWSAWNYYLSQVTGISDLPAEEAITGQPGSPSTVAISGPAYWAIMSGWLQKNKGFSGLGIFGGLGTVARMARKGESRWHW
jgi:hypothetical protein